MLVLTRRINQALMIGTDVTVTILAVGGSKVKIGIAAPKEVVVLREEVHQRNRLDQGTPPGPARR